MSRGERACVLLLPSTAGDSGGGHGGARAWPLALSARARASPRRGPGQELADSARRGTGPARAHRLWPWRCWSGAALPRGPSGAVARARITDSARACIGLGPGDAAARPRWVHGPDSAKRSPTACGRAVRGPQRRGLAFPGAREQGSPGGAAASGPDGSGVVPAQDLPDACVNGDRGSGSEALPRRVHGTDAASLAGPGQMGSGSWARANNPCACGRGGLRRSAAQAQLRPCGRGGHPPVARERRRGAQSRRAATTSNAKTQHPAMAE
jgi:hypothetical protein